MNKYFLVGTVVGVFVSIIIFGIMNTKAAEGPGVEVEDIKQELIEDNTKPDTTKSSDVSKELQGKLVSDSHIKSTEVIEDDIIETINEDGVKVVYRTPESCKEFTLYLDDLATRLREKDKTLKYKSKMLEQMKENMKELTANFLDIEKKIKKIVKYDSASLKDNPQLTKMIKLYETFTPEEAAVRLKNLDLDLTMAILKGMQAKKLSKILAVMDPKLSAALSSRIVRGF